MADKNAFLEYDRKSEQHASPVHRSQSSKSLPPETTHERHRKSHSPVSRPDKLERYLYHSLTPKPPEESKSHHAKLGEYTTSLWKKNHMTDVHVHVGERVFNAHRAVLSCHSPYFKKNLAQPVSSQVYTMHLTDTSPEVFKVILHYMYTGKLKLTCQNIGDVYRAARKLEMTEAQNRCAEILRGKSRYPVNSLYIYVTCKKLNLEPQSKRILKIILERFEEIVVTHDFMHLDIDCLEEILSSDWIGARSEMILYLAALKWIHHGQKEREKHAVRLMRCIRFPLMNLDEIIASYYPPLMPQVPEIPEVRKMIMDATCFVAAKMVKLEGSFQKYRARPRHFLVQKEPLVLWDISKNDSTHRSPSDLNSAAKTIQNHYRRYMGRKGQRGKDRQRDQAAKRIQSVWRGHNTRKSYGSLMACQPATPGPKTLIDSMSTDPCLHLLLYHRKMYEPSDTGPKPPDEHFPTKHLGKVEGPIQLPGTQVILLTGGINPFKPEDAVATGSMMLRYDAESSEWKRSGKMPFNRHHHCAAYVRGKVYIIGGCDPRMTFRNRMVATATCFRFDLKKQEWKQMTDMHHARIYHGVAVLHNIIYVIGGKNEFGRILSSIECYAPEMDQWLELDQPLCCPRMGMGVTAYQDMIWIVGGMVQPTEEDRLYLVRDVDCYDPHTNKFQNSKSHIPMPKCFLTIVECGNYLYAIGGVIRNDSKGDNLYLRSVADVQCFDYASNRWKDEGSLPSVRHTVAATSLGSFLYCIGGLSAQEMTPLSQVIVRDSQPKAWHLDSSLPMNLVGCSAITLPEADA